MTWVKGYEDVSLRTRSPSHKAALRTNHHIKSLQTKCEPRWTASNKTQRYEAKILADVTGGAGCSTWWRVGSRSSGLLKS